MAIDVHPHTHKDKLTFPNREGERLAALLEQPLDEPVAYVLFAHCFTCSKDVAAASRISRALAGKGFGVLRFDFTGLGNSEGDFGNTNFSSNVEDLISAAEYLASAHQAPALLVGHSLGGAAILAAAPRLPAAKAVVTIAAPSDPEHIRHLLADDIAAIDAEGCAMVELAGRRFPIRRQFLDDLEAQRLRPAIAGLKKALLVLHSPIDQVVGIDHARAIFEAARHPKSFVSLDDADHLLSQKADSQYVAETIAAWSARYVLSDMPAAEKPHDEPPTDEVTVTETDGKFGQVVQMGRHCLVADEPERYGGEDAGPSPYDLLLAGLGACTSMTIRMYATHKKLPLKRVSVKLNHKKIDARDCPDCETKSGKVDRISREIVIEGDLTDAQRERIAVIADRCPVHKTLYSEIIDETWVR